MTRHRIEWSAAVLPLLLYCALIYIISSLGTPPAPDLQIEWGDKVLHAGAFGGMTVLAYRAARYLLSSRRLAAHLAAAVLFASLYGATDEFHQSLVPGRFPDFVDWVADTVGALLAAAWIALTYRARWLQWLYGRSVRRASP